MPKIAVYPLKHSHYDDLVSALDLTRVQIAKLCQVSPHSVGWWRHTETIPQEHLEALASALRSKLGKQKSVSDVEQRALTFVQTALASGSAVNAPNSALSASSVSHFNLSQVNLEELIAELRRRGGTVTFGELRNSKKK